MLDGLFAAFGGDFPAFVNASKFAVTAAASVPINPLKAAMTFVPSRR